MSQAQRELVYEPRTKSISSNQQHTHQHEMDQLLALTRDKNASLAQLMVVSFFLIANVIDYSKVYRIPTS